MPRPLEDDKERAVHGDEPVAVTEELLRGWPLPRPDDDTSQGRGKDTRGAVLVAGGSIEVPGAIILAGVGALRAGAGKLQIATCREIAGAVAVAVPEARALGLAQTAGGDIDPSAAERLAEATGGAAAALIGPGMLDVPTAQALLRQLLPRVTDTALALDAAALAAVSEDRRALHHLEGNAVLTPHLVELALLLGVERDEIEADPLGMARRAAREARAMVALKGAETYIAAPDGTAYRYADGAIGLATSGSGDTLAGIVAGLLARGAEPLHAAVWAVYLHGEAGNTMSARMGKLGFLARELLADIPRVMARFDD